MAYASCYTAITWRRNAEAQEGRNNATFKNYCPKIAKTTNPCPIGLVGESNTRAIRTFAAFPAHASKECLSRRHRPFCGGIWVIFVPGANNRLAMCGTRVARDAASTLLCCLIDFFHITVKSLPPNPEVTCQANAPDDSPDKSRAAN